jgi:hypothetical protein
MARWYANRNGNINEPAMWENAGGLLAWQDLNLEDELIANGKQITINCDFACKAIKTTTNGGRFNIYTDQNIQGDIVAGTSTCLFLDLDSSAIVKGNVSGGTSIGAMGIHQDIGASLIVEGNVTAGSATSSFGIFAFYNAGHTLIIGNVSGGAQNTYGFYFMGDIATIIGNITAGDYAEAHAVRQHTEYSLLTIKDSNIRGSSAAIAYGVSSKPDASIKLENVNLIFDDAAAPVNGGLIDSSGQTLENYIQLQDGSKYPLQLTSNKVLKGVAHGSVVGTVAAASLFRRLNRFV